MRLVKRQIRIGALVVLAACSDGRGSTDSAEPCASEQLTVELGTGQYKVEPLADGDRVVIVNGPQGGWHLWTSGTVSATGPRISVLGTLEGQGLEQPLAGSNDEPVTLDLTDSAIGTWDPDTCTGTFFGRFTYVDDAVPPSGLSYLDLVCALERRQLSFGATVTDLGAGTVVSDERQVFGELDPANVAYCHSQ